MGEESSRGRPRVIRKGCGAEGSNTFTDGVGLNVNFLAQEETCELRVGREN